jgi:hypothetical protein
VRLVCESYPPPSFATQVSKLSNLRQHVQSRRFGVSVVVGTVDRLPENKSRISEKLANPRAKYKATEVAIMSHPLELQVNAPFIIVFSVCVSLSRPSRELSFRPNLAAC